MKTVRKYKKRKIGTAKKRRAKSARRVLEADVWYWCSKYIRARDSINGYGNCCVCKRLVNIKKADAGHFIGRGFGGGSGTKFDERNIHLQCKGCNAFRQGDLRYRDFMLKKYGQKAIDELRLKHRTHNYTLMELEGLKLYYKQAYKEIADGNKD